MNFDACATQRGEEIDLGQLLTEGQTQCLQTFVEGRDRVVADARDVAIAKIHGSQGLQNIVELAGSEINGQILIAMDAGRMLEVPDTILVEHDTPNRQATTRVRFNG